MNSDLQITIGHIGAELVSIQRDGREYLWSGDPQYWSRHATILFPIVGRLANDTLRINGKSYSMKQHGFARNAEFTLQNARLDIAPNNVVFNSVNPPVRYIMDRYGLIPNYPYEFSLAVDYEIQGNTVCCSWEVRNNGTDTMHFQIGAHPAFMLPEYDVNDAIHGYIQCYDSENNVVSPMIFSSLVNGLRVNYGQPKVLSNDRGILELTNTTFADDAILIEKKQVTKIALFDKHGKRILTVSCPQAEAFGIWAPNKPGCPFVCIEPWCGIADRFDFNGDIEEREYIHCLESGNTYLFSYSIQIH